MKDKADIGMIGLAVMGENLSLNLESKGYTVALYNRTVPGLEEGVVTRFIQGRGKGKNFIGSEKIEDFVSSLATPRKIMMMVKAGKAVDELIEQLIPLLDPGDILIDGGNSHFPDTMRRTSHLESKAMLFIGTGVSGGEQGALRGPSIMPGGSPAAWPQVKPMLQAISAKVADGTPCCDWVGENGAGHFVKMVHNGIEYGDMQLICEAYQVMKQLLDISAAEMHEVFKRWNTGDLNSYLIEITRDILAFKDADGEPLVEKILDTAGQKGTGKWTSVVSLDLGIPLTLISEAVYARCLSAMKDERMQASKTLQPSAQRFSGDKQALLNDLERALYASKIVSYAQGFALLREAAKEYKWSLNYGGIALLWRGGCIIRSAFLSKIKQAFDRDSHLSNLMLDPFFKERIERSEPAWRRVVSSAVMHGVWIPAMSSALCYYDGFRNPRLPANLLQAQRDYFGAHQYERTDKPRGQFFHTDWTGQGGETASSAYTV
ncbi:MAG: decarboxylating NADP(+)-dependent phosphogluconate dehydrogenase [Deltaproteobacteria bacterium]|nr:decarboxylating NADP(+)-dependent phosphogluconate dehydrogenase [Deltaproteobacteria bacterium]